MTEVNMNLLACDGTHGRYIYSTTGPGIARMLFGWGTVNSELDPTFKTGKVQDLCPHCMVELWVSRIITWLFGRASCGHEMSHGQTPGLEAIFVWDAYGDLKQSDVDDAMIEQQAAWGHC